MCSACLCVGECHCRSTLCRLLCPGQASGTGKARSLLPPGCSATAHYPTPVVKPSRQRPPQLLPTRLSHLAAPALQVNRANNEGGLRESHCQLAFPHGHGRKGGARACRGEAPMPQHGWQMGTTDGGSDPSTAAALAGPSGLVLLLDMWRGSLRASSRPPLQVPEHWWVPRHAHHLQPNPPAASPVPRPPPALQPAHRISKGSAVPSRRQRTTRDQWAQPPQASCGTWNVNLPVHGVRSCRRRLHSRLPHTRCLSHTGTRDCRV